MRFLFALFLLVSTAFAQTWNTTTVQTDFDTGQVRIKNSRGTGYLVLPASFSDMNKSVYDVNNNGTVDLADAVAWSAVTGKPASFPPSAHNHVFDDVPGLQAALDAKLNSSLVSAFALTVLDDTSATAFKTTLALQNVNNTSDANKPVSSATQTALDLKLDDSQATVTGLDILDSTSVSDAKLLLGLDNVSNTSDANKPISTAVQTALDAKAASSHTQPASTITDFNSAADARVTSGIATHTGLADPHTQYQRESEEGTANGYASLDSSSLVPLSQLPSSLDDVLAFTNQAAFPSTGSTNTLYVDNALNKIFRWTGSAYQELAIAGASTWGSITGTLSSQTDLQNALNAKEATITAGTTAQYWRGDKTFQTLNSAAVGLGNVPNTDATARANHTGTQLASTVSDFAEAAQDETLGVVADSSTLDWTYNDAGNTATASVIGSGLTGIPQSAVTNLSTNLANKMPFLASAAVQTANFTASANTYYAVDATSGNITVTLPTSNTGETLAVKKNDAGTNTVTLSGTINGVTSTTLVLRLQAQGKVMVSDGSGGWNIFAGDTALPTFDARYFQRSVYDTNSNNVADSVDSVAGSTVTNTPAGNIAATNAQAALNELDVEKTDCNERLRPCWDADFISAATTANPPFVGAAVASGTLVGNNGNITGSTPGMVRITSSTTANSGYRWQFDYDSLRIGGGEYCEVAGVPLVFTATTTRLCFVDTTSSTDVTDGAYIEIDTSGNALCKTSNNSTRTTSSTITTLSINTYYRFAVEVNLAASSVTCSVFNASGVSQGTPQSNTTNIPTNSGRETRAGFITSNSGTVATALFDLDRIFVTYIDSKTLTR